MNIGILTNLPLISKTMPYYDYAYECVKVLNSLWVKSNRLWNDNQDAISRMLIKQTATIVYEIIDDKTIAVLKKGNKYKLFKFIFKHKPSARVTFDYHWFGKLLEEFPKLEIVRLTLPKNYEGIIDKLVMRTQFETKQDLLEILDYHPDKFTLRSQKTAPIVTLPNDANKIGRCENVDTLFIDEINQNYELDFETNTVYIDSEWIKNITSYSLGTDKFFDSVKEAFITCK